MGVFPLCHEANAIFRLRVHACTPSETAWPPYSWHTPLLDGIAALHSLSTPERQAFVDMLGTTPQ